jgi:hypothetical protein
MEDRENRSQLRCGIKLQFSACCMISRESQSTCQLVKAGEEVLSLRASVNLESEYLATGFSLRTVGGREKASSQK